MKNLKNQISFSVLFVLMMMIVAPLFQGCDKDDDTSNAVPEITYVRLTDPAKSDSLLVSAYLGNNIALMGNNLQEVKEIYFNDQSAIINTSYVTNSTIIITVPSTIPTVVTDSITMITYSGIKSQFPFKVLVPAPQVNALYCEYVAEGEDAVVQGDFFIDDPNKPLEVIFPGNIKGTVKSVSINKIVVTVPAGAGIGPISVKSLYGTTRSSFYFRDDRNIILNFDNLLANGWRKGVLQSTDGISGNYVRFYGAMNPEGDKGEDPYSFNLWGSPNPALVDVPFYTGDLSGAVLKFEANISKDWKSAALQMIFTPSTTIETNSYIWNESVPRGLWIPWQNSGSYKTAGWTTVTIPLSTFNKTLGGGICTVPLTNDMLGGLTFIVHRGGVEGVDCEIEMWIDNVRIVSK